MFAVFDMAPRKAGAKLADGNALAMRRFNNYLQQNDENAKTSTRMSPRLSRWEIMS